MGHALVQGNKYPLTLQSQWVVAVIVTPLSTVLMVPNYSNAQSFTHFQSLFSCHPSPFLSFFFHSRSSCVVSSDTGDKELVKSAISIRMPAYSCSEPTLVNVRIEVLRTGQEAAFLSK